MRRLTSIVIATAVLFACAKKPFEAMSIEFGKDITRAGDISGHNLVFAFTPFSGGKRAKDIYNYLYFKGDTLCFRAEFSEEIQPESIEAFFISPQKRAPVPVERVEVQRTLVWGFSLVGSLLEHFYGDIPAPPDRFAGKKIPFEIHLRVKNRKGEVAMAIRSGSFIIEYR